MRMHASRITHHASRHSQRGIALIMVATAMTALLGFAAVAIDLAFVMETRAELQNAADAAALAGSSGLTISDDEPTRQAEAIRRALHFDDGVGVKNTVLGQPVNLATFDPDPLKFPVKVGRWDPVARTFSPWDGIHATNAVQVQLQVTRQTTPPLPPMFFGPVINADVSKVGVQAVAAFAKRNPIKIMFALDHSDTMNDDGVNPDRPLTDVRDATLTFLKVFGGVQISGDAVGTVAFDSSAYLPQGVTSVDRLSQVVTSHLTDVNVAVKNYGKHATGFTNIPGALCYARHQLQITFPGPSAPKAVALLSDGKANRGLYSPDTCGDERVISNTDALAQSLDQAHRLAAQKIILHTITFGKGVKLPLDLQTEEQRNAELNMQAMAQATGGQHFVAETGDEVLQIFAELFIQPGLHLVK